MRGLNLNPSLFEAILAIHHFSSQASGEDEIAQSIILKALSFIENFIVKIINASLELGVFQKKKSICFLPLLSRFKKVIRQHLFELDA